MALNLNKLKNAVANKPVDKPTGKDVAANYYARQLIDKEAKEQGAKTSALPSSADLYRQADLTGAAKGQGSQTLPSGAPVVRPAVQKSIDDYKAIDKAETLAKRGELTEKDAETLGKARNAVMADASAYDAVAAEQTPKMFAKKVQEASERDRLNWRNMSASEAVKDKSTSESVPDQGVFAGNRLAARTEAYYERYNRILDKYSRGTATADDIKALAMEQNRLKDDTNAYAERTTGKFEAAVKSAYDKSKGIGTWKDIHVGHENTVVLPKGYNKAALAKDMGRFNALYRDVYGKFINGKASVSELAEVKARENELRKKSAAYYDTIDGLVELGENYQKNKAVTEQILNNALESYNKANADLDTIDRQQVYDPNERTALARTYERSYAALKAAHAANDAAKGEIAYNDIKIEYLKAAESYTAAKKAGYKDPADVRKSMVQAVNANVDDAATYHVDDLQRYGTNEWKRIYLYLRETQGTKAANEFAKTIKPLVDVRHANIVAREYDDSGIIGKMGIGFSSQASGGLSDFGMGVVGTVKGLLGDDSYTFPATAQSVASAVRNEEKGVIAGAAMDIIRSTANMAPSIALGKITAAAGFIKAAPVIQSLAFGASAGGNSYLQAINDGKDAGEAFLYGAVSGASEVLLERVLGGITGFGTSGASKLLETSAGKTVRRRIAELLSQNVSSVSDRLRVQAISAAGRFISNGVSEGIEEFSQELLDPIFRNMIFAEENEVFTEENFKDALYAGTIGFFNSALLNLPNEYMQSGALRNLLRGQATDADINTVLSSPELIRDVERIFSYQFNMTTDEGGFRFSDNDTVNRTFLEMFNRGAAMGTKNADNVRRAAEEAGFSENMAENASAADVAAALAESINKASDSKTDLAAKEIRKDVKTDKAAEIKNETAKHVDAIANEQLEEMRQRAQAQRIQDEEYQPIASSRGELARFVDTLIGKEVWVDGEKRTVKGISKGAIQTVKENGTVVTDTLAGGGMTYNKHGFSVTGKNGTTREFYFGSDVGIKVEKSQAAEAQKAEQVEKDFAETSSIELKKPFPSYSEDKQKTIKEFVEYRDGRIGKYVDDILSGNQNAKNKLYLDTISDRAADDIQKVTGIDTHGFETVLFRNIVQHIEKRHGKNGLQDQSMKHIEDWERIQYVLNNYDTIQFAGSSSAFTITKNNGQQKSAPTVIYSKAINGTFYVVEAVPDTKNKTVNIVTAYTQQKGQNGSRDVQSPTVTPETTPVTDAPSAVDISLRENDVGNVGKNVNVLQNEADSAAAKAEKTQAEVPDGNSKEKVPEAESAYVFAQLPEHTVEEGKNTKTGATIYVLKLKDRVSTDDYKAINTEVRAQGGYYSRYARGFIVPKEIFDAYNAYADSQKAVDNKRDVGYNEVENVKETSAQAVPEKSEQLMTNLDAAVSSILSDSDEAAKLKADNRTAIRIFEHTPEVILRNVSDSKDLPVIINYTKLYLAARKDGAIKGNYHNLGDSVAAILRDTLENPEAIIRLGDNRLNLISEIDNGNKKSLVSVELNSTKDISGKYSDYNVVVTLFSPDEKYINNLLSRDGIAVEYKKEDLPQVNPQLYKRLAIINGKSSFDNSIAQSSENVNAENVKNGKEGIEDVQRRGVLDGESGHDGGRLRRGITGSDDGSGNSENVSEARKDGGRVLQGDSIDQASGRDGGNVSEGTHGSDVGGSDNGEVKESSSGRGRTGDVGRGDRGHDGLASEQLLNEESGADTESASDVSSDVKKAAKTVKDEKKAVKKVKAEKAQENAPEEVDTETTATLKKRPSNKENFSISDEVATKLDCTPPNAMDNIAAIRLLKRIEEEGRPATAEEKEILAKYKGWGGIDLRNLNYEARRDLGSLFSYEQRVAMQNSSLTAYFTPTKVIDAMYTGLTRMGFTGGNILESSMGIGNFFGRMPAAISAKSSLTGVEMESYTARIAQLLYPGATVINKPFQDVAMRNDAFDLVIGNVPFGTTKFSYGKKKYLIHNYFILSSLDKVREGGMVAVLTSAGTLDSYGIDARKAMMDKADVVACYKLPERVFSRNANTDVQTDLLILRKRAAGAKPAGDSILNVVTTKDGLRINEYFEKHPENVLGTLAKGTNAWGEITTVKGGTDFYERLTAAMNKLPSGLFTGKTTLAPVESIVSVSTKPRFFEQNGTIYEDSGEEKAIKVDEKKAGVVSDYIAVRDAYKEMLDAYSKNLPETDIKPLRDKLTSVYDNFTTKHGPVTGDGKKKDGAKKSANNTFLEADSDYYLVGGLEKYDEKAKKFEKSALFEKDTLRKKQVEHVDTASDALTISLNESGKVDFKRMHELTGMSEKKLIDELSGEIILTPDGDYVLTDIYLSGNIYEKLDAVKGKNGFEKQEEMLERAIPKPKSASEIDVKLGANYIDAKYIRDFARDVFRTRLEIGKDSAGHWSIEGARASRYGDILTVKYGLPGMNAVQLLEKILNDSEIKVMKTVNEGSQKRSVFDEEKTNVAMQKADDIREAFANWIFKSTERRNAVAAAYNRMYNNFKPLDYEKIAEKLSFDSMDADLKNKLYPHQKRAIARALFGGDVLFAHGVGTGKTFEMIASVMEAKRMGLVNKAVMVVPKNKVSDFKKDIARAYPNAKVLIVSTQNVKRQSMIGLVGSNDWDIVLLSRETFTKIPVSEQLQQNFVLQQLEEVQRELSEAEADKNTARRIINGLKKRSETLENKLKEIDKATKRDENSVDFEKLGIDCICVDEAHNYKSIVTPTRLNIKGLSKTGDSQRANDMLMKLDYMRTIGGKIIFGTGTPITNTVSEIYNMTRMVCPSVLEEAGIHSLDEWVNTFGKVESTTEIDIGNNIKNKSTQIIRKFINPNEMIGMFRQFADVVFTEDVVTNLPKAKYIQVEIEGTDVHKKVMETVGTALKNAKNSEKMKVSSQVMAMATAAAADPRMLAGADSVYNPFGDYSAEELEFENSKMNKMCDITFDEYKKSNDIKGTQIIFCDSGAGSGTVYSFNLHKDIKEKLIKRGIPENEIVIVQSQSDEKLEELFRQVNDGEVRVLIGTSAKMAEGLNVQKRVVAIHHPTVTFTPADLEQGNARGVRQGNMNDEVRIYNYVQGDTFDAYKWQAQARKGEMIKRALRGEAVSELEDVGDDIDPADAMAVASGNPLVKDKIDIDKEVVRLKNLQRNYLNEVYSYQDTVSKNPDLISQTKRYIANMERDIGIRDKYSEKDSVVLGGKEYTKQAEANKALTNAVQKAPKDGEYKKLGTFDGFDIMFKGETGGLNYSILLKGANGYAVEYAGSGNNIARFAGALRRLDTALEKEKARLEALISDLELAKKEANKPFEHQSELESALQKQKDITYQYEHYNEKKPETPAEKADSESDSDVSYYKAASKAEGARKEITVSDVEALRSIGRKSVNDFTSEDIKKAEPFARRYFKELGVKSPFFRAWFGDWRAHDTSKIKPIHVNMHKSEIERGHFVNEDTGWNIGVSSVGINDTISHSGKEKLSVIAMNNLGDIIRNSVLLDSETSQTGGKKGSNTMFMHKLYAPTYIGNRLYVSKLTVEEYRSGTDTNKRFYNLAEIKMSPALGGLSDNNTASTMRISDDINSVTQLYPFVKAYDKDFHAKDVNPELLDKNGMPKTESVTAYAKQFGFAADDGISEYRADKREADKWKTKRAESFKDSGAKVKPIPEIVDKIREKFDVPVRTGNMHARGAHGQYDERQNSIRTRFANDLPILSHELGHYLDAEYGFSEREEMKPLIHALPEPFKEMYSESKLPGEAFAEYLREYLKNKDTAAKKYAAFTELFERTLSDGDMQSVNELADDTNAYLSSTPEERLEASVLSKEKIAKRDKISKSEAFDNMRHRLKDYFVDDISALEELGELVGIDSVKNGRKSPYALAFLARKAEYTGYHIITNELCDMEGNPVGKSLMERLYPVGNNMDNFNYYLVAKRAVEVLKRNPDLPLMPDPTLNDAEELQRIVDEYDRRYPEFEKVSEDVYDFLRQVQRLYGQASGVESAEQLDFLEDIYPHYVPLKRALKRSSEKLTGGAKSGYANQNSTIKRFKGSTEEFVAPTDSMIDMVMRVVKVARRNAVGAAIADIANKNEGLASIIERVEPDKTMQSFNLMKQKEELVDKALAGGMVDEEGKFKDLINSIFDDVQMKFVPYVNGGKNIVSFRVNGETQYFQIGNKRLYNAVANINSNDIEPTLKVLNKIQGIMKYGIVGVNPAFIVGNFSRDIGTAWYSSDEMNFASFAASYVATAKDILLNDPEYKRFLAMGGGHNVRIEWKKYYIKKEMERMVRAGDKKGLQKLWNELSEPYQLGAELYAETHNPLHLAAGALGIAGKAVGKVPETIGETSEFVESIPRAQEFIRKAKDDPVGAMYAADEITTNNLKHGQARWVNDVFIFGNTIIQGAYKIFRHYTKGTKKELAMRWAKLILTGIAFEALQAAFNRDDKEEYENLSTYTKNNNYVLSLGHGRFFKVPKPREFGVLSSAIGRSIEYVFGNDEAFYDFADYLFDTFSPPGIPSITDFDNSDGKAFEKVIHGVLGDTLFSGAFDIGFNIDYKGDEIVPSYMDNYKTESDKVYDTTSKVAIAIGKMFNMSPIKVDYLLSNGFGVFGRAAQYLLPNDSSRRDLTLGIKSRLIAQSQYSTDVYDLVYEKAEKAKKAYDAEEKKGYSAETLLEYEDTQMLKTLVSQYRRSIRYSNLTTKEKEQRLSELQALIRSWDSTPIEADKRSIELFESTGNADVFYKTFASNIESTLTGKVKVPQYEDGKIVAVKTMNYTAELSPDAYLMFFNDACKVIDEAKLALLNADEVDDEVKAKKVAKNIKDGITKLKKRYLEDYGKPAEEAE